MHRTHRIGGRDNEGINEAIKEIGVPGEQRRLTTLVEQMTGFAEADLSRQRSPELRKLVTNFMGFEAMTKIAGGDATMPLRINGSDQLYYVKLITNKGTVTKKILASKL